MPHAPRPAPRVLLAARYAAPRAALLARPAGPVAGVDLASGTPVQLELVSDGPGLEAWSLHRGRRLVVREPVGAWREVPQRVSEPRAPRARPSRARAVRLVRLALAGLLAGGVAMLVPALGGGRHAPPRAAAAPHRTPARALEVPAVVVPVRAHVAHVPRVVRPTARGGPAEALLAAPAAHRPGPVEHVIATPLPAGRVSRAPTSSTGWVAGLFEGP